MAPVLNMVFLALPLMLTVPGAELVSGDTLLQPVVEPFPILSYDSDTGFGYGGKLVVLNQLGVRESFDLTLYGSTKGERWYRFAVSFPDRELRQGTSYPMAFDAVVDYDKWISSSFFGIGNESPFAAREIYTKEVFDASFSISRGFTENLVGEAALRWYAVRASHLETAGRLITILGEAGIPRAGQFSAGLSLRYDSRDDFIEPREGTVIAGTAERAFSGDQVFNRFSASFCWYRPVLTGECAFRFLTQWVDGDAHTPLVFPSIGGSSTLRGSVMDRFIDRGMAVANAEVRLPFWGRLGCIAGLDAGKVWASPKDFDLSRWTACPVVGLRLRMQTFVARLDVGFGRETTGVYANFGHLF